MVWRWSGRWRERPPSDSPHTSTPLSRKLKWKSGPWMSADPIVSRNAIWWCTISFKAAGLRSPLHFEPKLDRCANVKLAGVSDEESREYDDFSTRLDQLSMDSYRADCKKRDCCSLYMLRKKYNWGAKAMRKVLNIPVQKYYGLQLTLGLYILTKTFFLII